MFFLEQILFIIWNTPTRCPACKSIVYPKFDKCPVCGSELKSVIEY